MSQHEATISWRRNDEVFTDGKYSRGHSWRFDGGLMVAASASPHVVRAPFSIAEAVDPEEAFVASLSSCHMLWFLDLAARAGFVVEAYEDPAVGRMAKNTSGRLAIVEVVLRPKVVFAGDHQPSAADVASLHHRAHAECFIANSVKTDVRVEPR